MCFVHEPWLLRPEEREGDDEDESDVDRTGTLDSRPVGVVGDPDARVDVPECLVVGETDQAELPSSPAASVMPTAMGPAAPQIPIATAARDPRADVHRPRGRGAVEAFFAWPA